MHIGKEDIKATALAKILVIIFIILLDESGTRKEEERQLKLQTFNDEKYLNTAIECAEVVWKRGILLKGYSLCHGVAGNGYTFLTLYQFNKDPKHLHRAGKFAEWCFTYGSYEQHTPNHRISLYEGVIGVLYFIEDMLNPKEAAFPGFAL